MASVEVAAAAIQLDVEGAHHYHLGGTDDVRHGRVHLRVEVLEAHVHHRRPGILAVLEHQLEQHLDDAPLGGVSRAPRSWRGAAVTAEEVLHQDEDQARLHGDERRPLEGGGSGTMFRLVGTNRVCTYSPNLSICTPLMETSAVRRIMLNRLMRM